MLKDFLVKKMLQSKLKGVPEAQKMQIMDLFLNNQDFFKKMALEIQEEVKKGKTNTEAMQIVAIKYQEEIKKMAEKNEAVIVIGSKESANSTRLFEIAKEKNPKTYSVENAGQLKKTWFWGTKKVFITAGASTPSWIIKEVAKKLAFSL